MEITSNVFSSDYADALNPFKVHGSKAVELFHYEYGECGFERKSDWTRFANKIENYDFTPIFRDLGGKKGKDGVHRYDHGTFVAECRSYNEVVIRFKEPVQVVVDVVGDKKITTPVQTMKGTITFEWFFTRGSELEIADSCDVYLHELEYID